MSAPSPYSVTPGALATKLLAVVNGVTVLKGLTVTFAGVPVTTATFGGGVPVPTANVTLPFPVIAEVASIVALVPTVIVPVDDVRILMLPEFEELPDVSH